MKFLRSKQQIWVDTRSVCAFSYYEYMKMPVSPVCVSFRRTKASWTCDAGGPVGWRCRPAPDAAQDLGGDQGQLQTRVSNPHRCHWVKRVRSSWHNINIMTCILWLTLHWLIIFLTVNLVFFFLFFFRRCNHLLNLKGGRCLWSEYWPAEKRPGQSQRPHDVALPHPVATADPLPPHQHQQLLSKHPHCSLFTGQHQHVGRLLLPLAGNSLFSLYTPWNVFWLTVYQLWQGSIEIKRNVSSTINLNNTLFLLCCCFFK